MTAKSNLKNCKINLICGTLGAGKTTLLRHLLKQKPPQENWAIIVNEFGAIGLDGAILNSQNIAAVEEIPGGCICCSALPELKKTITDLLSRQTYDRILIEPTGLSEIDTLVDLLNELKTGFANLQKTSLENIVCIFAANELDIEQWQNKLSYQNLSNMADILILNKTDLCTKTHLSTLTTYAEGLYPPKQAILLTEQAKLALDQLKPSARSAKLSYFHSSSQAFSLTTQRDGHQLTPTPVKTEMPEHAYLKAFQQQTSSKGCSFGWLFSVQAEFDWQKLQALFNQFSQKPEFSNLQRMKGVFRVGSPWMLFQWRQGQLSRELISYRKDSRIELLFNTDINGNNVTAIAFFHRLLDCLKTP